MKKLNYILIITLVLFCVTLVSFADDTKHDLSLTLGYYNNNNRLQYLMVHAKSKINKKFELIQGIKMRFYITDETPANLLGTAVTDNKGEAFVLIPPSAKQEWLKSAKQSFIVVSEPAKNFDQTKGTADITKARIKIDTTADRKIVAVVTELKDSVWTPVKGVEMKIGIRRMSADLNVNETPTYTTDSLGTVSAEFKRDSLPGNAKGMLTLVAKIEDNDLYGNLTAELSSNWGAVPSYISEFDKRTLFARRGKSPIWLELIAYSIVASVWGVLLYLVGQIRKLKKMSTV
jgi:hypothetical protein